MLNDAYQIMAHEMAHDAIAKGDINLDEIRTMLEGHFTADELNDMARQYASAFTTADGKCVMTAAEAFEEICCDAKRKTQKTARHKIMCRAVFA